MFDTAVQTNRTSPIKHKNRRNVSKLFDQKFDGLQILSNTIKHDQTAPNKAGVDQHQFPSFYRNRSDFSESLRNPKKGTLGIKKSRTFRKGVHLKGTCCFGNRSPFILDSHLQAGQTVKCLVTKQCLIVFGCQTFLIWTGL